MTTPEDTPALPTFTLDTTEPGCLVIDGVDVSRYIYSATVVKEAGEAARLRLDLAPMLLGTVTGSAAIDAVLSPDDAAAQWAALCADVEAQIRALDPRVVRDLVDARSASMGDDPVALVLAVVADQFHEAVKRQEQMAETDVDIVDGAGRPAP